MGKKSGKKITVFCGNFFKEVSVFTSLTVLYPYTLSTISSQLFAAPVSAAKKSRTSVTILAVGQTAD